MRVIAATNTDLIQAISEKSFREDLFFRLNAIPIHLPPLRPSVSALASVRILPSECLATFLLTASLVSFEELTRSELKFWKLGKKVRT